MILEFLVRHGLKPLVAAVIIGLLVSFLPFYQWEPSSTENLTDQTETSSSIEHEFLEYEKDDLWPDYVLENEAADMPAETASVENVSAPSVNVNTSESQEQIETVNSTEVPVVDFSKNNMTKNTDYADWLSWFIPDFWEITVQKDKFLKLVGVRSHAVCEVIPDALDYSGGWQSRSMSYLYHSNKTRVSCKPFVHPGGKPQLTVIDGQTLSDHLNDTTGKRLCTVVFFFSGVCPFSRRAAPLMHSAAVYFPTIRFFAVDTDKFPGVAGHYGIMGVPVVVMFFEKKFLTGWTIPYPDARDTIRAFIMAHSDAKYIKGPQNVTFTDDSILDHFHLKKQNDVFYMISYFIIVAAMVRIFWDRVLWDLIQRSLDRSGLDGTRFILRPQQPLPMGQDAPIPAPVVEPEVEAHLQ